VAPAYAPGVRLDKGGGYLKDADGLCHVYTYGAGTTSGVIGTSTADVAGLLKDVSVRCGVRCIYTAVTFQMVLPCSAGR
jgi:hypothetical protein